jgi:hypothetical protein
MSGYASLFKENNITGKRLLLLDEEDLKDMGIVSKGHIIHFKVPGEGEHPFHTPLTKHSAGCHVHNQLLPSGCPYSFLIIPQKTG